VLKSEVSITQRKIQPSDSVPKPIQFIKTFIIKELFLIKPPINEGVEAM
jgi:hypothetical protein